MERLSIDLGQNPKYLSQSIKINRDQSRIFSTFNGRPAAPKCAGALKLGKFVHYWTKIDATKEISWIFSGSVVFLVDLKSLFFRSDSVWSTRSRPQ